MNSETFTKIFELVNTNYHGDLDLFIHDLKEKYESQKSLEAQNTSTSSSRRDKSEKVIINIESVNKEYKTGSETLRVLKNINLEIYEGEIVALIGPSGSGKSTLLNLIGGLDTPTSGKLEVNGQELGKMNDFQLSNYRNQTIGFIFQFFNLQSYLNIKENVEVPLMFRAEEESERTKQSTIAVEEVSLSDRIKHLPSELSGGQMQRVAIARSIINKPKIILADEPTGNLDRNTGIEIIKLLKKINQELGTTILIVTHDNFIAGQADRIIRMNDGELADANSAQDFSPSQSKKIAVKAESTSK